MPTLNLINVGKAMKEFYVVTNGRGDFIGVDSASGGYPYQSNYPFIFHDLNHATMYAADVNQPDNPRFPHGPYQPYRMMFVPLN